MQKKMNRAISLAMSAALMLTNLISPMKAFAEYTITLPFYDDILYMVDEGRVFHPENERPEDKDIILKCLADEKVEFAFTPENL